MHFVAMWNPKVCFSAVAVDEYITMIIDIYLPVQGILST